MMRPRAGPDTWDLPPWPRTPASLRQAASSRKIGYPIARHWRMFRAIHPGYDDLAAHDALMRMLDTSHVHCADPDGTPLTQVSFRQLEIQLTPGQPRGPAKYTPLELFNAAAAARLERSRWFDVPEMPEKGKSSAGKGGRPPHSYWPILGVEVGAWLTDVGAPHTPDSVISFIEKRLVDHGFDEPDRKRIWEWAERFLVAYRDYRGPACQRRNSDLPVSLCARC